MRNLAAIFSLAAILLQPGARLLAADAAIPQPVRQMLETRCLDCHDAEVKKGNLDLTALKFDLNDATTFATWVKVHDRVRDGEMPPKKKEQPDERTKRSFLTALAKPMIAADEKRAAEEGRAIWRRMNRYEYENTLRDLLGAPWLQIKEMLPEDGEAFRFNKVGTALDVSHVQMARYLGAAEYALREVIAANASQPQITRHYAREQPAFYRRVKYSVFNRSPERATFPLLGNEADMPALEGTAPMTVGTNDPARRELESIGVVASSYEPIEIKFDGFTAPAAGRYKLRFNAHSFWAGPDNEKTWWKPSRTNLTAGRTHEPVSIYAETPPRLLRKLGNFVVTPEPTVNELDVYLLKGETIRPDAVRLFRSRPPGGWHNPLAEKDGQPGVTFRWLEVEGPLPEAQTAAGMRLLFGELEAKPDADGHVSVTPKNAPADAERLLKSFLQRAYRQPADDADRQRFLGVVEKALNSGSPFSEAMIAGYSAVLCSPGFVTLEEQPGRLDNHALASRLSYFLWNSEPDAELRSLAASGKLQKSEVLRQQVDRLLGDARSQRFVEAFLDYWLDLRKANATSPDAGLYPDYYLDDYLVESAVDETRAFFAELIRRDLHARNVIASDFAMLNERLAAHYDVTGVKGVALQRVSLPKNSPRGGLLTQASVLKVTANGTTTSPVLRGVWMVERILGQPVPPPPAAVPAVEPDTRGATTIREQLDKHRNVESCNACHVKIDPAGFALESFDVLGGWRKHYRAVGDDKPGDAPAGYGKNGQPFEFHDGPVVDASGALPDGRAFRDVNELKRLLLQDERQIARNLANQLVIYATAAPVRFGDRPAVEAILDKAKSSQYGVKAIIHEIVQSPLFRNK